MSNPHHLSKTNEHPTPLDVIQRAREVLGNIDLDPASSPDFNKRIGARGIYTIDDDGLSKPWRGTVFLNPPGGKILGQAAAALWWKKLYVEWDRGQVTSAIFIGFSLAIFRTAQALGCPAPYKFPFCVPKSRLRFGGNSPTHDNAIIFLPSKINPEFSVMKFREVFSVLGQVRT